MLNIIKKTKALLIIGIILSGVFLPTIIGDVNNRLITFPAIIGLVLVGYSIAKLTQK